MVKVPSHLRFPGYGPEIYSLITSHRISSTTGFNRSPRKEDDRVKLFNELDRYSCFRGYSLLLLTALSLRLLDDGRARMCEELVKTKFGVKQHLVCFNYTRLQTKHRMIPSVSKSEQRPGLSYDVLKVLASLACLRCDLRTSTYFKKNRISWNERYL